MSWANDLKRLTTKGGKDLGELAQAVKIDMFSGIVSDTRVDTGRLKSNWQIQENSPASGELESVDNTPLGTISSASEAKVIGGSTSDGKTYFVNNLIYARIFEEKDAMVRRNIIRVKQNIKNMARKVKG